MEAHDRLATRHTPMQRLLRGLVAAGARFPWMMLLLCAGTALASAWYSASRLGLKTSRADLIDSGADYHQRWLNYTREFGDVTEDIVVVVEAEEAARIERVLEDLGPRVEREAHLFKDVLYKVDLSRLRAKALQYSSPRQLESIVTRLDELGPLLQRFQLLTLGSTARELRLALMQASAHPQAAAPIVAQVARLAESLERFAGVPHEYQSPWQHLLDSGGASLAAMFHDRYLINDAGTMGFLKARPAALATDFSGAAPAINRLRVLLDEVARRHPSTRIGLTGIPVLESDEMRDSQQAMTSASMLSLAATFVLLVLGLRSLAYPVLVMVPLAVGMAWSFGFTTAAIGHLNILSVSFAAMLVGIGIDFPIVFLERYIDQRRSGNPLRPALLQTATSVGPAIVTASATTAAAFFVAVFTDFSGVAELGIIAGGGILLCLLASFLALPATLAVCDQRLKVSALPSPFSGNRLRGLIARRPMVMGTCCSLLIAWVALHGLQVKYDYNLLNLQTKGLDSVEVQKRIFEQSDSSLLFAVSLAETPEQVLELKRKFETLPTVHHVEEIASVLPRIATEDTQLFIQGIHSQLAQLPSRAPAARVVDPSRVGAELERIEELLTRLPAPGAAAASAALGRFLERLDLLEDEQQVRLLRDYQNCLANDLLGRLRSLEQISSDTPASIEDLAPALVRRFKSPHRKWLLQIYPKSQIWDLPPLEAFVADVRSVDPEATGTPLQTYEASRAIRQSYIQAGLYAAAAVLLIALVDFRNLLHALLALLPAYAGCALTFGVMGMCGIDLNPANMIILPLIVGIGVDGGVHIVHDFLAQQDRYVTSGSTFNAVLLNGATTITGFGSMLIAHHRGLFSLGLVLSLGVAACLFVSLVFLPAVLTMVSRAKHGGDGPSVVGASRYVPAPHLTAVTEESAVPAAA
jgi:hypothetical protein